MLRLTSLITAVLLCCLSQVGQTQEISTYPYFEGFESTDFENEWNVQSIFYDYDTRPYYGTALDRWTPTWIRKSEGRNTNDREAPSDGYNSAYFLMIQHNYNTYDHSRVADPYARVISPTFMFDSIASATLSFRYHMWQQEYSMSWLSLEIMINNSGEYIELFRDSTNHHDVWKLRSIELRDFISNQDEITKLNFRFVSKFPPQYHLHYVSNISIDAFEIKDIVYKDQPVTDATNWVEVDTTGIALTNRHMAVMSNTVDPDHELWVNGSLKAKEVLISVDSVPDYVFKENYPLKSLEEIENYIQANHHLPDVPSEADYSSREGVAVGELNMLLLRKIEEMTLHMIEMNKEMQLLKEKTEVLKN